MNEDFSEIFSKFSDILKEKNIDLNDIAGGATPPAKSAEDSDFSLDIETIMKIKDILSKINKNKDDMLEFEINTTKIYALTSNNYKEIIENEYKNHLNKGEKHD